MLGIEHIGVHDIVFDLKADSIDIARVRNRLISMLSIDVAIVLLFEKPTIAQQANELSKLVVYRLSNGCEERGAFSK